jgi:hypothetical protein
MRKVLTSILVVLIVLTLVGGLVTAQSSTYTPPPTPPVFPPPTLPTDPGFEIPADWIKIDILNQHQITLILGGPPATLIATVPGQLAPYDLYWMAKHPDIVSVFANSPAQVTALKVGETSVLAVVATANATYYDECAVRVTSADVALPPTSGVSPLNTMLLGLLMLAALPALRRLTS